MEIKEIIALVSLMVTAVSAAYAARRFSIEQRLRTKLTALERVDLLYENSKARNGLYVLDWSSKRLAVDSLDSVWVGSNIIVATQENVLAALSVQGFSSHGDMDVVYLRDCMDALCSELVVFAHFVDEGIFNHNDLKPYLGYYASEINGTGNGYMSEDVRTAFIKFVEFYYSQNDLIRFLTKIASR